MLRSNAGPWAAVLTAGGLLAVAGPAGAQSWQGGQHQRGHYLHYGFPHHHGLAFPHGHQRPFGLGPRYLPYSWYGYRSFYPGYPLGLAPGLVSVYGTYPFGAPAFSAVAVEPAPSVRITIIPTATAPEVAPAADLSATVRVLVPDPQATVWFDGRRTSTTGTTRSFQTPQLEIGRTYQYDVRAAWDEGGRTVSEERTATVTAGGTVILDFTEGARAVR